MPARNNALSRVGFTLIELLVVIAIITVLAGILFPVFGSVRSASHKAACQSNLKQLYSAFQMYTQDLDGVLPCPGGVIGSHSYWAQEGDGIEKYLNVQRMGLRSSYCCPAYSGRWKEYKYSPRTYSMNSFLREPPDLPYPACLTVMKGVCIANIVSPSQTILLYEGVPADSTNPQYGEGYVYRCGDWTQVRGYYPKGNKYWKDADKAWHHGRNNYLMVDGHIITMDTPTYPDFTGPTGTADNLWFVNRLREEE